MAYQVRYSATVNWVGPNGLGMNAGSTIAPVGPPQGQHLLFPGAGVGSGTFTAADITTILTAITTDLSAQMNAQIARVQAFSTGGG